MIDSKHYINFKSIFMISIFIITLFLSGCQRNEVKDKSDNMPPLLIFSQANVDAKILNIKSDTGLVTMILKIIDIKDYAPSESKEILLYEGENISLYISGIGNTDKWKTNLLSENLIINLDIRCLDGRINSKDPFTKDSCYWESNEESIVVI